MSNRSRWQTGESFEIPQTPLIDIIFILIVFFLVATTFYSEERDINVNLPEGSEGTIISREKERFVINVRQGGILVVENDVLTLETLEDQLRAYHAAEGSFVEIRGDTSAQHGRIMAVINLCKKTGLSELSLTQHIVERKE